MKPCTQCGKCCIQYSDGGLSVTQDEINAWELFRPDIAEYVQQGEIWFDPRTKQRFSRCPWLQEAQDNERTIYSCSIYFDRPNDCRYYPVSISEMVRDECEMIELKDLKNIKKAQTELDKLMEDSRPALDE